MTSSGTGPWAEQIVVGYDGSTNAVAALEWAAREAAGRGAGLRVVMTLPRFFEGMAAPIGSISSVVPAPAHHTVETVGEDARRLAAKFLPEDRVRLTEEVGSPAAVLIRASERARMLVVGNRGHGSFGSMVLGSVSSAVAGHAACPVTVVRGAVDDPDHRRPVTVGVDYVEPSAPAVLVAAELASRWAVPLRVVSAWASLDQGAAVLPHLRPDSVAELARSRFDMARVAAEQAAEAARAQAPGLEVDVITPEAPAAVVLEDDSRRSGLVVLGTRRLGPLMRLVLGSVSHAVLNHASCPVTIVPGPVEEPASHH